MIKLLPVYLIATLTIFTTSLSDVYASMACSSTAFNLPASLISFKAKAVNKKVTLDWQSSKETNVSQYIIERSSRDMKFLAITNVIAKGEPATITSYHAIDIQPLPGTAHYRLKVVNHDGTFAYSLIATVQTDNPDIQKMMLYPNPSDGKTLNFNLGLTDSPVTVKLFDIIGNSIDYTITERNNGFIAVRFSKELPTGMYVAVITHTHNHQTTFLKYTVR